GPIYDDSRGRKLMRSIVEAPQPDEWKAMAVASVFADHATDDDLRSVWAGLGFIAADGSASFASIADNYGRHLGRMLVLPPKAGADGALRDEIRTTLKSWLEAATAAAPLRGAALQAFFEAGDLDIVSRWFDMVLSQHGSEPCEVLRLLPGSLRLLQHPRFPAATRDRLRSASASAIAAFLADPPPRTTVTASQEPVRCLRGAVRVLLPTLKGADLSPMLTLFTHRFSGIWLGIDLLQDVRFELQRTRAVLVEPAKAELDQVFLRLLTEDAALLRDASLGEDGRAAFLDRRDLRYNAAGYVLDTIDKDKALVERVADRPEALETFIGLAVAALDPDARGVVREKTETGVTLCELLGKLRGDFEEEIDRGLLQRLLIHQLRVEVGDADSERAGGGGATTSPIAVTTRKRPADAWVKDHVIEALKALGFTVTEAGETLTIE
ncbi:MAG: hypothetical protein U1E76_08795, partial [Planctomycetota bacterium]